jgi:hypothetical protein
MVYFSENSLFVKDYPKLALRRVDFRYVVVPHTRLPVTRLNSDMRDAYKEHNLRPYTMQMNYPDDKNLIFDTTFYTNIVDQTYKPNTYRQRAGFLIQNILSKSFQAFPDNYRKVLAYAVDTNEPINSFVNRKVFPILRQLRTKEIYFDDLLLIVVGDTGARYRLLVKDQDYKFQRVVQYIKTIKPDDTEEDKEKEVVNATLKIMKHVASNIAKPDTVKYAVKDYLDKNPKMVEKIANDELSSEEMDKLTAASIFFRTSGDLSKANRLAKAIPSGKAKTAVQRISKQYEDDLLKKQPSENLSDFVYNQTEPLAEMVDNKTPEHIFDKRRIDFETNLRKDIFIESIPVKISEETLEKVLRDQSMTLL